MRKRQLVIGDIFINLCPDDWIFLSILNGAAKLYSFADVFNLFLRDVRYRWCTLTLDWKDKTVKSSGRNI